MMPDCQTMFSWSHIAQQWDKEFQCDELVEAANLVLEKDPTMAQFLPVQLQQRMGLETTY